MSRRGRDPNHITEHAHRYAQRHKKEGYRAQSPEEVCATIDEIRETPRGDGGKWTVPRLAKALNARKIIRGNWNGQGTHRFSNNSTKELYRNYTGTPLGGAWRKKREETKQTVLPGLTRNGQSKPGPKAQSTAQAREFVRNNPRYHILSKTAFEKFVRSELNKGNRGTDIAGALNKIRALRPTYTSGDTEWTTFTVADLFRRCAGRSLTDVRLGRRRTKTAQPKKHKITMADIDTRAIAKQLEKKQPKPCMDNFRPRRSIKKTKPKALKKKTFNSLLTELRVKEMRFVPGKTGTVQFIFSREGSLEDPEVAKLFNENHDKLQTD